MKNNMKLEYKITESKTITATRDQILKMKNKMKFSKENEKSIEVYVDGEVVNVTQKIEVVQKMFSEMAEKLKNLKG